MRAAQLKLWTYRHWMLSRIREEINSLEPLGGLTVLWPTTFLTSCKGRIEMPPEASPFGLKEPFFTGKIFLIGLLTSSLCLINHVLPEEVLMS